MTHERDRGLALAEGLVNSHLPSGEHVALDSPGALASFLEAYGVPVRELPGERDVEEVHRLRGRLRAAFEASGPDRTAAELNDLLEDAGVRPRLAAPGGTGWHIDYLPADASLARRVAAQTAIALVTVVAEQGAERLRVCAWETCRDVFVDRSRNRSRRFCSPQLCGNRAAVAAWRARQREATEASR